jgi:hypothetical protein
MNRFDRIVWRINGILFLVVLIAACWALISTFRFQSSFSSPRPGRTDVRPATTVKSGETLEFGDANRVKGTNFLRIPLNAHQASDGAFSSKSFGEHRLCNFRFVDTNDLSAWWLFEGFDRLVTHVHDLHPPDARSDTPVIATFYEVVTADTDGDGRLTPNDREAVYFCTPDGRKPKEVVPPSDGVLSFEQVSQEVVLIICRRADAIVAGLFSIKGGSKIKETVVASSKEG